MAFDAAVASRIITNERLRSSGWADFRDLGGALVLSSDAPIDGLNCMVGFTANDRNIESLLDIGFALLRAFDRMPAAELTPLDRPKSLPERLERRGLRKTGGKLYLLLRDDAPAIATNRDVAIKTVGPDDVRAFAQIHGGSDRWARKLSLGSTMEGIHEPGNTFYLGIIDGEPAGSGHLLIDGKTAAIYALATLRAHRGKGIATAIVARAIADARAADCDCISISTDLSNPARSIYEGVGFAPFFESALWTVPVPA
jgi:ribosomal protein S18 acetylase RimI-like enzyme